MQRFAFFVNHLFYCIASFEAPCAPRLRQAAFQREANYSKGYRALQAQFIRPSARIGRLPHLQRRQSSANIVPYQFDLYKDSAAVKLIRKTILIRQQNNATVHCEIELCETADSPPRYLVNLRQGRAGQEWRETTRTLQPVHLSVAESLFTQALAERHAQGFIDPQAVPAQGPQPYPAPADRQKDPGDDAILARFAPAVWKTLGQQQRNRTIWRVGMRRLRAAVPMLVDLIQRGDNMQDYCIAWSIGRCGDPGAAIAMRELHKRGKTDPVRRIAQQAWLMLADQGTLERHASALVADWPAWLREAWAAGNENALDMLTARADQWHRFPLTDWLEQLDQVALAQPMARRLLIKRIRMIPLRAGVFRAVRHIYKAAELRSDPELFGIIHHRFETTPSSGDGDGWVRTSKGFVRFADEVKTPASEVAYSSRTRDYLLRRSWRTLRRLGQLDDPDYVELALGALLAMDDSTAGKPYKRGHRVLDAYSHWLLFNNMLRSRSAWKSSRSGRTWFQEYTIAPPDARQEAFPRLWDARPDGLLYLMQHSQCAGVHAFAARALIDNHAFCADLSLDTVRELLRSRYEATARFAYLLVRQRFEPGVPDIAWLMLLMQSSLPEALKYATDCISGDPASYCADAVLVAAVATAADADVRQLARLLCQCALTLPGQPAAIVLQILEWLEHCGDIDSAEATVPLIAVDLLWLLQHPLLSAAAAAPYENVLGLLAHRLSSVRVLGCEWLLLHTAPASDLPAFLLKELLQSPDLALRSAAIRLFGRLPVHILSEQAELIASFCTHADERVRKAIDPVLQRIAPDHPALRAAVFPLLIDMLFRAEAADGVHADIAAWIAGPFKDEHQLHEPDLVRRLLSARGKGAQRLGALLLPRFVPAHFTVADWAGFGRNPNLSVRQWSFAAFDAHPDQVRAELEQALRIFDSRFDDSKQFASEYFQRHMPRDAWSPLLLVNLCDHLDPAVQRFGRTMITTHFDVADVTEYMIKLSQHPSANMQLFVSAWLESASAGDVDKLQRLELYFLAVLSQVNRGRVVKARVQAFLSEQATLSEDIAAFVARLFARQVVTVAIADKASYIEALRAIQERFPNLPNVMIVHPPRSHAIEGETR